MIKFFVPTEPRAKQSYRASRRGGGYQTARVKAWQSDVGWAAQQAMRAENLYEPLTKALSLEVVLEFSISNHRRIDLDNLSKAVLDGLNGIAYEDDQQIIELHISKIINPEKPGVKVFIGIRGEFSVLPGLIENLVTT
jgi:crossover junction endodeoxyribonuclease RusA